MSKVDVIMPQMGESIAEGTLTRWLKNVGDAVERDEDLFEISTDKVDADIPSPAAGVLAEVLVQGGETVEIDTVVARIETDATAATPAAPPSPGAEPPLDPPLEAPSAQPVTSTAAAAIPAALPGDAPPASPRPAARAGAAGGPASRDERLRTRSTPLVRKIAAEHGVDIHQVPGTGASGRVTRDDILAFISAGGPEAAAAPATAPAPVTAAVPAPIPASDVKAPTPAPEPAAPGTLQIPIHGATLDVRLGSVPIRERDRVEEMSRVRLRTMEHMLMSKRVSAHVTSVTEVDFERIVQLRRSLKPRFAP